MFSRCSVTNLKYWSSSERIINKTLQLLSDLSVGYSSVRKLVKLEAVQFVLHNQSERLPRGAPASTQLTMVWISSSVKLISLENEP